MSINRVGRRIPNRYLFSSPEEGLGAAQRLAAAGDLVQAIDICEALMKAFPQAVASICVQAWDYYATARSRDRYTLYQSRFFDFDIKPGSQVLDIGSGHMPFPFATHLADFAVEDNAYGRGGAPMKKLAGRELYQCSVEKMPFSDRQFDFVYCSHVLEHTTDPAAACRELMRVGRRGYIETPSKAKDQWMNSADLSNHRWWVDIEQGRLVFTEYTPQEIKGIGCGILMSMHCDPQTPREKAFASLIWLKSDVVNTMFMWEDHFDWEIRRQSGEVTRSMPDVKPVITAATQENASTVCVTPESARTMDDTIKAPNHHPEFDNLLPRSFAIETVLGCNLRCPECAIGTGTLTRQRGMLSFDKYEIIAEKIKPFAQHLYLHLWGEPLLNPDIMRMVRHAAGFTRTNISTNAMRLSPQLAEELVLSGVHEIIVSIDGITQETYARYRVGGEVTKALESLAQLAAAKKRHGAAVSLIPQFVVFAHNQDEMELFRLFCADLGLTASFKAPYIRPGSAFENGNLPQYVRPRFQSVEELRQGMRACPPVRQDFVILLDGTVVACCHDFNARSSFGNILRQEVMEIWNSPAYRDFRWSVLSGHAPQYCIDTCMSFFLQ
jgi:MoaA/NifB/PqqE/SkfB family radical SAM enzyme/ubiquinone/menaquinone biosynthesis C-methylase UbiE